MLEQKIEIMENKEGIVKKIRALLSKTEGNGATKAEAEIALSKAKDLMQAYFISEHDITDPYAYKTCVMKHIERYKSGYKLDWFIVSLTELFDCLVWLEDRNHVIFYGFEQDVELCEYFYHYLVRVILHEKDMYMMSLEAMELKDTMSVKSITKSFLFGFQKGLNEKLKELYNDRNKHIEKVGLVLYDKMNNVRDQLDKQHGLKVRYFNQKTNIKSMDALQEGMEKGRQIDINQGLQEKRFKGKMLSI